MKNIISILNYIQKAPRKKVDYWDIWVEKIVRL
jgi:hypothetical protein